MSTKDEIKDYNLRLKTVEPHNGTFKRIYNYDYIPINWLKKSTKSNVHHCSIIQPNKTI